jgi:AcrR family transcriptional regulator
LFARKGYTATSIRDIASLSGDTIGTLSYHFGSKDALLSEVIARRFDEMTAKRRALYHRMLRASPDGRVGLEDTVRAITTPFLEAALCSGPQWRDYTILLSRMMYTVDLQKFEEFIALVDPVAREFVTWIQAAAPEAPISSVAYGYQFMIGCIVDACVMEERDRVGHISDGAMHSGDFETLNEHIIAFLVAGLKGLFDLPAMRTSTDRLLPGAADPIGSPAC